MIIFKNVSLHVHIRVYSIFFFAFTHVYAVTLANIMKDIGSPILSHSFNSLYTHINWAYTFPVVVFQGSIGVVSYSLQFVVPCHINIAIIGTAWSLMHVGYCAHSLNMFPVCQGDESHPWTIYFLHLSPWPSSHYVL